VTRAEDLRPGSQVQSRGGSDTPALPAETKYVLASEAFIWCFRTSEWYGQLADHIGDSTPKIDEPQNRIDKQGEMTSVDANTSAPTSTGTFSSDIHKSGVGPHYQ